MPRQPRPKSPNMILVGLVYGHPPWRSLVGPAARWRRRRLRAVPRVRRARTTIGIPDDDRHPRQRTRRTQLRRPALARCRPPCLTASGPVPGSTRHAAAGWSVRPVSSGSGCKPSAPPTAHRQTSLDAAPSGHQRGGPGALLGFRQGLLSSYGGSVVKPGPVGFRRLGGIARLRGRRA